MAGMTQTLRRIPVSEDDLLAFVIDLARQRGWLTYHTRFSRGSDAGFPDLVLLRPPRLVLAELKRDGKNPTPAQGQWLGELEQVALALELEHGGRAGLEVYIWRPADQDEIQRVLL
jgi:hypothetical protein